MTGYGTEEGYDYIVLKSYIDRFWGVRSGRLFASSERAGPWEKFEPIFHGDNVVSLMTDSGTYVSCDNGGILDMGAAKTDKKKITDREKFYVYKTAACGKDWDTPNNGSDCIAFKSKATGYWLSADSSYLKGIAKALDPTTLPLINPIGLSKNIIRAANPEITCDRQRAGEFEKFYGWTEPISWTAQAKVENIVGSWHRVASASQDIN